MVKGIAILMIFSIVGLINSSFIVKKKKKKTTKTATKTVKKSHTPYYNDKYELVVDKSSYQLQVYDAEGWLATYPVVFGKNGMQDKKMEGDQATPEGTFRITFKNPNHKWEKFLMFDYPTTESYRKFNARKANGEIPSSATIGGGVGIHGTWPGSDHVVDNYINWTEGCISMKNSDVKELYDLLPMHTKITIKK